MFRQTVDLLNNVWLTGLVALVLIILLLLLLPVFRLSAWLATLIGRGWAGGPRRHPARRHSAWCRRGAGHFGRAGAKLVRSRPKTIALLIERDGSKIFVPVQLG
jgi:hypothetical protein